ncbi:unnamed protein product [Ixodes persulcatus]
MILTLKKFPAHSFLYCLFRQKVEKTCNVPQIPQFHCNRKGKKISSRSAATRGSHRNHRVMSARKVNTSISSPLPPPNSCLGRSPRPSKMLSSCSALS